MPNKTDSPFTPHRPDHGPLPRDLASAPRISHARFAIGDVVRHAIFDFRGVVFDIDPAFANSEEWYEAIPESIRPRRDQPFYHLLAESSESSYVAYVSQQNLVEDKSGGPIDHPALPTMFSREPAGNYRMDPRHWH